MKKLIKKFAYYSVLGVFTVALAALGLNAADNRGNLKESMIGRLIYGSSDAKCPADMVYVTTETGGFCLDAYEASPGPNCPRSSIGSPEDTRSDLNEASCLPASVSGASPWTFISQSQAMEACARAGKRLPTDEEWFLGALGTPDKDSGWTPDDCQVANNWSAQPGHTGAGPLCRSGAGAYDMVGNVWEWVKAQAADGKIDGASLPPAGYIQSVDLAGRPIATDGSVPSPDMGNDYLWLKDNDVRGMARGGYWDNRSDAGRYAIYLVPPPTFAGAGVGFRCAK